MLTIDADRHNFGQLVRPMERASFLYYRKPRPVVWERLFFGKESEICSLFSETGENGSRPLAASLFNLEVDVESDWLGYSREVLRSDSEVSTEHFYSFGVLLAYAFVFGIRDLHKFNLIKTDTHFQVIDAEVVLTQLTLPNETILLPFKDISFEISAARLLSDSMENFSPEQRRLIFSGYFDLFASVFRNHSSLLPKLEGAVTEAPIRIIFRNTRIYADHLQGIRKIEDLMPEEAVQLERGDVPYFFKRLNDNRVSWISSNNGDTSPVAALGEFQADIDRHVQPPFVLIGDLMMVERKMAQGALLLQRQLAARESFDFAWNASRLSLGPGKLENGATKSVFRTKPAR